MGYFAFQIRAKAAVPSNLVSKLGKIVCPTMATHKLIYRRAAVEFCGSSRCCTVVHFLHTLYSFVSAMHRFLTPKSKTNEQQDMLRDGSVFESRCRSTPWGSIFTKGMG